MSVKESYAGKINRKLNKKLRVIAVAAGREPADLVLKNATYVNVFSNELCHGDIAVAEGLIVGMGEYSGAVEVDVSGKIVLPGFVDAHIHLESSLVSPTEFAKAVLPHGTTTVITDPHEIANVMGTDGIEYMLQATEDLPVDVRFMLPSCVPATPLDESGANLDYRAIDSFYDHPRVQGLAEMMNFVGTINGDPQVVEKIVASQAHHKKIDGHAPDLKGNDLNAYIAAGVYSDHECHDLADAIAKLERGQFIMIREGTAARNLEALVPLLCDKYVERCMFCTDDKHPNDLLEKGHIDYIVKKAIKLGADPITAIKAACHNAARYFLLNNRGAIAPGYLGDFVIIDSFEHFNIEKVFKKGELMYSDGVLKDFPTPEIDPYLVKHAHDTFHVAPLTAADFTDSRPHAVIGMVSGEITTTDGGYTDRIDVDYDILKIAVIERHKNTHHIGLGYIKGYGIRAAVWAGANLDKEAAPMLFDRGIVAPGVDAGYVDNDSAFGGKAFPGKIRQYNPGTQPFLKVNRNGERFANESCPYNDIVYAAAHQPGRVYAQICDANILEDAKRFHTIGCSAQTRNGGEKYIQGKMDEAIEAGALFKCDTLDELADKMGFTGAAKDTFLATVERYNELYDKQNDEDFGKPAYRLSAIRTAPFYGCWLGASLLTTEQGIAINEKGQALDTNNQPMEGLYITGDMSGSFFANNYPCLMAGVAMGRTLTFAMKAIKQMAGLENA